MQNEKIYMSTKFRVGRAPTRSEIEAELQSRKKKATWRAGMSHISSGSRKGATVDLNSPLSRVSNAGEDRDLHKRILRLEESMKLIMVALKIRGLETTEIVKDNPRRMEKLDTAKEAIGGVEIFDTTKEDIEGVVNISTTKNIGGARARRPYKRK